MGDKSRYLLLNSSLWRTEELPLLALTKDLGLLRPTPWLGYGSESARSRMSGILTPSQVPLIPWTSTMTKRKKTKTKTKSPFVTDVHPVNQFDVFAPGKRQSRSLEAPPSRSLMMIWMTSEKNPQSRPDHSERANRDR